jgi:hypothetical protein
MLIKNFIKVITLLSNTIFFFHFMSIVTNIPIGKSVTTNEIRDIKISDLNNETTYLSDSEIRKLFTTYLHPKREATIDVWAGCPNHLKSVFVHSSSHQAFERHCLYELLYQLSQEPGVDSNVLFSCFLEIVTKGLVYREMEIGTVIIVNSFIVYAVWTKIVTGRGFTAIWLKKIIGSECTGIPEYILVVCGSQFHPSGLDSLSTVRNDMQPHLGWEAMESAQLILEGLFSDVIHESPIPTIWVTGHSLGGNLAQQVVVRFPKYISKMVIFNPAGVSHLVHTRFPVHKRVTNEEELGLFDKIDFTDEENEGEMKSHPIVEIHCSKGDPVHLFGGYILGALTPDDVDVRIIVYEISSWKGAPHTYFCISNPLGLRIHRKESSDRKVILAMSSPPLEFCRYALGIPISPLLWVWRWGVRAIVPSRASESKKLIKYQQKCDW